MPLPSFLSPTFGDSRAPATAFWSITRLVLTIVALIFVGDLLVLTVTERLWQHRFGVWTEILFDDIALSAAFPPPTGLFADGFESGGVSNWSASVP